MLVHEHVALVRDPDGTAYRACVWARRAPLGRWSGFVEFVPERGGGRAERTGSETTQPSSAGVARWATGLGPLYLEGALRRAHRRSGVDHDPRTILVGEHETPVVDREGRGFRARTWARVTQFGSLMAWIEFEPEDGLGPALVTDTESTQPDLDSVVYWSQGLQPVYLEGALRRAARGK